MPSHYWSLALGFVAFGNAACTRTWETTEIGNICVGAGGPGTSMAIYEAGPADVRVNFAECVKGCERVVEATCEMEIVDRVVTITGRAEVEREGRLCDPICQVANAECGSIELAVGHYAFVAGDLRYEVDVPSETDLPCAIRQ